MKNVKLSVVLATFNEEKNIGPCLKSVQRITDEMIVVDGSSTDKTTFLAKKLGAKVFTLPNVAMFHKNKQIALGKANGEWILQLDADERVTQKLREEIIKKISRKPKENGYFIPRKNYFLGKLLSKGGQYPDYVIRLVRKGKAHFPCQTVHEQIKVKGKVGYLKNPLLHYTAPTFGRYLQNSNRYTSLTAKEMAKEKLKLSLFNYLKYGLWMPLVTFFKIYIRHKGFIDGMAGFIFALFSGLHWPVAFYKYIKVKR